jgi:glycosyltransferase involved in cell wall biosynthesis
MARGLPAVIHKSGGAWSDIVMEGEFGLGYMNTEDAVDAISRLFTNKNVWDITSRKSIERAKNLTFENFMNRFYDLVKKI